MKESSGPGVGDFKSTSASSRKEPIRNESKQQPTWKGSQGKIYLERELRDVSSRFHTMSIKEIHASDRCFSLYPLKNFTTNFNNLKRRIAETNARVEFDNRAVSEHKRNFSRPHTTHGGYQHWNGHSAKKQLEDDVRDGIADKMTPQELWNQRDVYKEIPPAVFCKRVHSEKQKQRGAAFWVEKRNRKGMKQRLEEVDEIEKS